MLVGILGINHKLSHLKLRERLAKAALRKFGPEHSIHNHHIFILLSTCNRTEIYFHSQDLAATHTYIMSILRNEVDDDFEQKLYSYFGLDCFLHLARVTAGLDSAILAETEIQGQVKQAYESASYCRMLPKELHFLFQKALKIGKKVRFNSPLQRGSPSLEHGLFKVGKEYFKDPLNVKILFIGASTINSKIIRYFKSKNCSHMTLCNRSDEKSKKIAENFELNFVPWDDLKKACEYDWIICGTKAPYYLLKNHLLFNSKIQHKLIIDLSVPRNVDPAIGLLPGVILINMDEMNDLLNKRTVHMADTLQKTEEMIAYETKRHIINFKEREQYALNILHSTA